MALSRRGVGRRRDWIGEWTTNRPAKSKRLRRAVLGMAAITVRMAAAVITDRRTGPALHRRGLVMSARAAIGSEWANTHVKPHAQSVPPVLTCE